MRNNTRRLYLATKTFTMTENAELMRQAREALSGKWAIAIGTFVIYFLIIAAAQLIPIVGEIGGLVISGPFALGIVIFTLGITRGRTVEVADIFEGFKKFEVSFLTYLLMSIFIILWALLLIVPGIIAAISYSQAFFIIADDPSIRPMQAIDKSKEMMDGYKWKYFRLCLRLYGLALLCLLTLGIGFLWFFPYAYVCFARFYDDISGNGLDILPENTDGSLLHGVI